MYGITMKYLVNANLLSAVNWADAKRRVFKSYRDWLRAVSLPLPNSSLTTGSRYLAAFRLIRTNPGPGNPTDVLAQHAGISIANQDTTRV